MTPARPLGALGEEDPPPERTEPDPRLGRPVAGRYRLLEAIGEGAMGRVYRAEHIDIGRPVAIKLLHPHLGDDPRVAKRFHREARAASRITHASALRIHDVGADEDGTLFLAMELVEGPDLAEVLARDAPLSPRRIAELLGPALEAIDEAHQAGVVHRDLKPENLLVARDPAGGERVTVCDFGIAKILEGDRGTTTLTVDGYVCGTPEYMSPEQARGEPVDPRADVYAAGAVLYQLLTGTVPFDAETALGVSTRHLTEAPEAPSSRRPDWGIPPGLEAVALRALAKDPGQRFGSAGEMATALAQAVDGLGPDAERDLADLRGSLAARAPREARRGRPPWARWALAGALALGLLGA
ncbi:MAG: serine/threonine-protein kinase, partial [Sandaracinaceae bacterium]